LEREIIMAIALHFERKDLDKLKASKKKTVPMKDYVSTVEALLNEIESLYKEKGWA
jgi:hypothetical protein